jgi:hypothetical protein
MVRTGVAKESTTNPARVPWRRSKQSCANAGIKGVQRSEARVISSQVTLAHPAAATGLSARVTNAIRADSHGTTLALTAWSWSGGLESDASSMSTEARRARMIGTQALDTDTLAMWSSTVPMISWG